jgi:hypothetical protein
MNQPPIRTISDVADYFGLRIELRDDLPANSGGYLDSHKEPQYIAVNRNLPLCEQIFTIAHEICHYINHHNKPRRKYRNRLLDRQYTSRRAKFLVRCMRQGVNRFLPIETEADMFAMSWLIYFGTPEDRREFIDRHPEKTWLFFAVTIDALIRMPFRYIKFGFQKLLLAQTKE